MSFVIDSFKGLFVFAMVGGGGILGVWLVGWTSDEAMKSSRPLLGIIGGGAIMIFAVAMVAGISLSRMKP